MNKEIVMNELVKMIENTKIEIIELEEEVLKLNSIDNE